LIAVRRKPLGPTQEPPGALIVTDLDLVSPGANVKLGLLGISENPSSGNVAIKTNVEGRLVALSLFVSVTVYES
jgi:hypothetical protein